MSNLPEHTDTTADAHSQLTAQRHTPTPTTPPRPAYSPFTPTLSHSGLLAEEHFTLPPSEEKPAWESEWINEPEPTPVNLDGNTDAIALRAAISVLQLQRQQAIRDMKALDRMKRLAKERPEAFLQQLKSGGLAKGSSQNIELDDDNDDDEEVKDDHLPANEDESGEDFGKFPTPQNVVRVPPVEWEKYHVVGEPLDRLHRQQQVRPGTLDQDEIPRPVHVVAAPYRPLVDKLDGEENFRGSRPAIVD